MPYIKQSCRECVDGSIEQLADDIMDQCHDPFALSGILNYCITTLVMKCFKRMVGSFKYGHLALISGMLSGVSDEFYRRFVSKYEDSKINENEDIEVYKTEFNHAEDNNG